MAVSYYETKTRNKRMSQDQVQGLVDAVCRDINLHSEKSFSAHGKQANRARWREVGVILNELGPPKDWKGWRQSWIDLKNRVRGRARDIDLAKTTPGSAPPLPPLTDLELKVMSIVGRGNTNGVETKREDTEQSLYDLASASAEYDMASTSAEYDMQPTPAEYDLQPTQANFDPPSTSETMSTPYNASPRRLRRAVILSSMRPTNEMRSPYSWATRRRRLGGLPSSQVTNDGLQDIARQVEKIADSNAQIAVAIGQMATAMAQAAAAAVELASGWNK